MTRRWGPLLVAIAMLASTSALAQDEAGGTAPGGVTNGNAAPPTAEPAVAPNAPVQATEQGPLPAGDQAGTFTASNWQVDPVYAAVGAAAIGGAICFAVCNSGHSSTGSTTTTTHK